jgi:hypothetical protein
VLLRPQFVEELIFMTRDLITTRIDSLNYRCNLNIQYSFIDFLVYYSLATQAYNSLSLNHQESACYKLKALKFAGIVVPDWLTPLIQVIGNYVTNEGVVVVKAIEQLVPYWTLKAIKAYKAMLLTRDGINDFEQFDDDDIYIWPSSDTRTDIYHRLAMENTGMFDAVDISVSQGRTAPMAIDFLNIEAQDGLALISNAQLCIMDEPRRQRLKAYLLMRDADTRLTLSSPDFEQVRSLLKIKNGEPTYSITKLVYWFGIIAPRVSSKFNHVLTEIGPAHVFSPAEGGTSAQLVKPLDHNGSIHSAVGIHDYSISATSGMFGLMLFPALSTQYLSRYKVESELSRANVFARYAQQMIKPK